MKHRASSTGLACLLALGACTVSDVYDRPALDSATTQALPAYTAPTNTPRPPAALSAEAIATAPIGTVLPPAEMPVAIAPPSIPAATPELVSEPSVIAAASAFVEAPTDSAPQMTAPEPVLIAPEPMTAMPQQQIAPQVYGFTPSADDEPDLEIEPSGMVYDEPVMEIAPSGPAIAPVIPDAAIGGAVTEQKPGFFTRLAGLPGRLMPSLGRGNLGASDAACRRKLKSLGVVFTEAGRVGNPGGRSCGIANAVKVAGFSGGIKLEPAATLNCAMAVAVAEWVKQDVAPAARSRYLSGVRSIQQMSSYSCRTIGNRRGGTLSEHSFGNAIDIGAVTLNNGNKVTVRKPGLFALRESSLLKKIRVDACDHFTTVLGPGYNADHADHFHFDLMSRRKGTCK